MPLSVMLALALTVGSSNGAVLSGSGVTATVNTALTPSQLPSHGLAPTTLALSGTINTPAGAPSPTFNSIKFLLDRQLRLNTTDLPTCPTGKVVPGESPTEARRRCGKALVGTGSLTQESPYGQWSSQVLLFNAPGSHIVFYAYYVRLGGYFGFADRGNVRAHSLEVLSLPPGTNAIGFDLRIGRTWHLPGRRLSYLSGQCTRGTLQNHLTLGLVGSGSISGVISGPCTKRRS